MSTFTEDATESPAEMQEQKQMVDALKGAKEAGATGAALKAEQAENPITQTVESLEDMAAHCPCPEGNNALLRSLATALDAAANPDDPALAALGFDGDKLARDGMAAAHEGFRMMLLQALDNIRARAQAQRDQADVASKAALQNPPADTKAGDVAQRRSATGSREL